MLKAWVVDEDCRSVLVNGYSSNNVVGTINQCVIFRKYFVYNITFY